MTRWREDRASFAPKPGVDPAAQVAASAVLDPTARLGPYCVVEESRIGARCDLASHVVVRRSRLGEDGRFAPFVSLGGRANDLEYGDGEGEVHIGARAVVAEGVSISVGTGKGDGMTSLGDDCMLMQHAHIGHDCRLGDGVILGPNTLIGGLVRLGDGVRINAVSSVAPQRQVGAYAWVGGYGGVGANVAPYTRSYGNPVRITGVNSVGLRRAGFAEERITRIGAMLAAVFVRGVGGNLSSRIAALRDGFDAEDPDLRRLLAFLESGGPFARHMRR